MMKRTSRLFRATLPSLLLIGLGATFPACKGEVEGEAPKPAEPAEKKSNVVKITTAVMPGKKLACADVFPDMAVFSETMGVEIGPMKDKSRNNGMATMVCSVIRGGEVAETAKEAKTLQEKYSRLGVLPGDSFCQITAYCSRASNKDEFEKKCESDGNQGSLLGGEFACVRATEKGPEYSYTYKFIEPDTKCVVEALAGPSVNDQEMVKNCALAARTAITTASVSKPL